MKNEQWFKTPVVNGFFTLSLLSLSGCDYWPPALQNQIDTLHMALNEALDDRQRLELEVAELTAAQSLVRQEGEERPPTAQTQPPRLTAEPTEPAGAGIASNDDASHSDATTFSAIRKGSYVSLQLERPYLKGPRISQLQRLLRRHKLPVPVDGIYGPTTAAAVRSFKRVHGLQADDIAGPATFRALQRALPTSRLTRHLRLQRPPLKGPDVSRVQRALRRAGYRIPVDGHYGPATDIAVTRFQQKHGLEPDGMVGPHTWTKLRAGRR